MQRKQNSTGGEHGAGEGAGGAGNGHNYKLNRAAPQTQPLPVEDADTDGPVLETSWAQGSVVDRRSGLDRREIAARLGRPADSRSEDGTGLDRQRGPGRRRTDFAKSAEEGEMTNEQFLFVMAIDGFKKANGKMFPTWTDVLEVVRLLGYRKTMPSELNMKNTEDWREAHDTPSGVRAKPGHPELPREREAA